MFIKVILRCTRIGKDGVVSTEYSLSEEPTCVCIGDYVEIRVELEGNSRGTVYEILSQTDPPRVRLLNGDTGYVVRIINSEVKILQRIMNEDQNTENKECFGEEIMRNKVIPQTVQSFLNSEGGRLYIGVKDTGELNDRLVGLNYDFEMLDSSNKTNDRLCDLLKMQIINSLDKYLHSEMSLGELVNVEVVSVREVQLVEVRIKKSPVPWFYRHISKNGKVKQFEICINGKQVQQRALDDFYIRQGNGKKILDTHEKFYTYIKAHYQNQQLVGDQKWV